MVKRAIAAATSSTITNSSSPLPTSKVSWRRSYARMVEITQKTSAAVNSENFEAKERNGPGRARLGSPVEGSAMFVHRLS